MAEGDRLMFSELKDIEGLDGYLIRIATIGNLANLQHNTFKVSKEEVNMSLKDMFHRVRRIIEDEYKSVYRLLHSRKRILSRNIKRLFWLCWITQELLSRC